MIEETSQFGVLYYVCFVYPPQDFVPHEREVRRNGSKGPLIVPIEGLALIIGQVGLLL